MQTAVMAFSGLASLFVGWVLMFVLPDVCAASWSILALGAALVLGAFLIDFRRVRGPLISQRGRFGIGVAVRICLVISIVLISNALSVQNSLRFDFTGLSQFTLTSQTKDVLGKLNAPVEALEFFSPRVPPAVAGYADNLLKEYRRYTHRLVVKQVDPDVNPDQARRYGVDRYAATYGAVVFRSEQRQRQISGPQIAAEAEHAFSTALLEVTGARQRKVYFLTGHGEADIQRDYSEAAEGLRDNLFQVDALDLVTTPRIPEDAAALVLAGPRHPLTQSEEELLAAHLHAGGRALVLLDPDPSAEIRRLVSSWGLDVADGVLVEPTSFVAPSKDTLLVPRNRNGFGLSEMYFPGAAALIPQPKLPNGVSVSPLVWTSPEAWLSTEVVAGKEPVFHAGVDHKGPFAIGALVAWGSETDAAGQKGTRLAVIGDSDFASNRNFHNGANADLFFTTINWLIEGKEIISVDRKVLDVRRLVLTPEQARFLQVSSIGLLPLLLLSIGGGVFWRRRS